MELAWNGPSNVRFPSGYIENLKYKHAQAQAQANVSIKEIGENLFVRHSCNLILDSNETNTLLCAHISHRVFTTSCLPFCFSLQFTIVRSNYCFEGAYIVVAHVNEDGLRFKLTTRYTQRAHRIR